MFLAAVVGKFCRIPGSVYGPNAKIYISLGRCMTVQTLMG